MRYVNYCVGEVNLKFISDQLLQVLLAKAIILLEDLRFFSFDLFLSRIDEVVDRLVFLLKDDVLVK